MKLLMSHGLCKTLEILFSFFSFVLRLIRAFASDKNSLLPPVYVLFPVYCTYLFMAFFTLSFQRFLRLTFGHLPLRFHSFLPVLSFCTLHDHSILWVITKFIIYTTLFLVLTILYHISLSICFCFLKMELLIFP